MNLMHAASRTASRTASHTTPRTAPLAQPGAEPSARPRIKPSDPRRQAGRALWYALAAVAVLAAALGALAWSNRPVTLPLAPLPADLALPPARPPAGMSLSALPTGAMHSKAAFAFRGGSITEDRLFAQTGILVRHPRGDLLFDTGMGRQAAAHFRATPALMQSFSRLDLGTPVLDQLRAGGYDPRRLAAIVPTHVHWDHISGVPDFPATPVWLNAAETDFIRSGGHASELMRSFGAVKLQPIRLDGPAYLGFASSFDVWGDGSIVLVPAPGHTPGSVIAFITLPSGQRYALVGDLVWQTDGIERPAERPWMSRMLVDVDGAAVRAAVSHVAALHRRFPQISWVPAHDARAMGSLPVFPAAAQ